MANVKERALYVVYRPIGESCPRPMPLGATVLGQ